MILTVFILSAIVLLISTESAEPDSVLIKVKVRD
jgi:hypothetical protein